jgi:hypothetical protein
MKLNVSAESCPGSTCRLLLDNFETIVQIAIKDHCDGEINEGVYAEALAVWEAFLLFYDVVTRGCDDNDHVAVEGHAQELDNIGVVFLAAYSEVTTDTHVNVCMHIMACHMGDLVREWGGLMKWCSQAAEAMHQMTNFFARKRSARRGNVSQVVLTRVHMLMKMRAQTSRRQRVRHTGKHVTCTGHVSKAKREVHEHAQNKLKTKYSAHNFNESRAMKRARGE